jgi:DNA-binding NarL/FixJ family response regulator
MTEKYKIALADDEFLFRKGLELIINQDEMLEVTFSASNGKELVDALQKEELVCDVILLDLSMPIMDGIDALRAINKLENKQKVIILTSHYDRNMIIKLLDEGAASFLAKNEDPDVLVQTLKNVIAKGFHFDDHLLRLLREKMSFGKKSKQNIELTEREIEVLRLICQEYTNKEIGEQLFLSPRTVDGHRNNILEKTGVKNTVGLVLYAIEHGLINVFGMKGK